MALYFLDSHFLIPFLIMYLEILLNDDGGNLKVTLYPEYIFLYMVLIAFYWAFVEKIAVWLYGLIKFLAWN